LIPVRIIALLNVNTKSVVCVEHPLGEPAAAGCPAQQVLLILREERQVVEGWRAVVVQDLGQLADILLAKIENLHGGWVDDAAQDPSVGRLR
jgi:hypothetical protein